MSKHSRARRKMLVQDLRDRAALGQTAATLKIVHHDVQHLMDLASYAAAISRPAWHEIARVPLVPEFGSDQLKSIQIELPTRREAFPK